jgi:hypothetical protein
MSETTGRHAIMTALRNANLDSLPGLTVRTLAAFTGYPAPSVRRIIAELRSYGHNIKREGKLVRLVAVA